MITLGPVEQARDLAPARWAAPALAVAGAFAAALAPDACSGPLALPAAGLGLTVAGAIVWIAGIRREDRDRVALAIGVAIALLTTAALQQLLVCMLGRTGMAAVELLQAGGFLLLVCALVGELVRWRRAGTLGRGRLGG